MPKLWIYKEIKPIFAAAWLLPVLIAAWQWFNNPAYRSFSPNTRETLIILMFLLPCSLLLPAQLPSPFKDPDGSDTVRISSFALRIATVGAILFAAPAIFRSLVLLGLPVIAIILLLKSKERPPWREILYACLLAAGAGTAGLGHGGLHNITSAQWALLQAILTSSGLLAGWSILRRTGLSDRGIGHSRVLSSGILSGVKSFARGALLAVPWALCNALGGAARSDPWVNAWWQPFTAAQPAIAEEAWGRMLMVPLIFLFLRPAGKERKAFGASMIIAAYWFSFLHTSGNFDALVSALILGTLFALPLSYLCLYRDLETAIGFHFCIDFVRFCAAFAVFRG